MAKPPVHATLTWTGDLRFDAEIGAVRLTLDSAAVSGPSPVQALATSLAGCMGMDVVHILKTGRHPFTGVSLTIDGDRAGEDPRRLVRVRLHCRVSGAVPPAAVERALQLSRDKYCSVWHSMRQDIELTTSFEVVA